jgi:WD40 repeat protein
VSYSRQDKAFVQRLDQALRDRQREAWVDWEGILPTEEFMPPASPVRTLPGEIVSIRLTANGRCLAVCIAGDAAQVFDLSSGEPLTQPLHHDGMAVRTADLSGDGTLLATAFGRANPSLSSEPDSPGYGRIWDVATGKPIGSRLEHGRAVLDIRFDAAGSRIATASEDQTARVWDAHTGKAITDPLRHDSAVQSVRFSPDGTRLTAAAEPFSIWEIAAAQRVAIPPLNHVILADYSPDGQQIASVINGQDDDANQLQHVQLLSERNSRQAPSGIRFLCSPDGFWPTPGNARCPPTAPSRRGPISSAARQRRTRRA